MKKYIMAQGIERYYPKLQHWLHKKGVNKDDAHDAMHDMLDQILTQGLYSKFEGEAIDSRLYVFLQRFTNYALLRIHRKRKACSEVESTIVAREENDGIECYAQSSHYDVTALLECPFCFVGILNTFGACANCNTILGKEVRLVETERLEEVIPLSKEDVIKAIDVKYALAGLSDFEQRVAAHVIHGTDSLSDLPELSGSSRMRLWRTWVRVKHKLEPLLAAYKPRKARGKLAVA